MSNARAMLNLLACHEDATATAVDRKATGRVRGPATEISNDTSRTPVPKNAHPGRKL